MISVNYLTANEVATQLKITPQYVRKLIKEGHLEATKIGTQWVVPPEKLAQYMETYKPTIEPDDHERRRNSLPPIVALSFFSGAMGLDIGMKSGGISPLLACEFNKYCRMTIDKNEPDIALIGDINRYSSSEILQMAKIPKDRKVDVIYGGPPCQAFSTAGNRLGFNDDRGNVLLKYLEIIGEILPTYVVIENVRGLLSSAYPYKNYEQPIKGAALKIILEKLEKLGYGVSFNLYNSANFGAPQIRERVVIVGKLGGEKLPYLVPTNSQDSSFNLPAWRTLGDALAKEMTTKHHHIEFPESRLKYYRLLKEGQYWKHLPLSLQKEAMGGKLELGGGKTGFYRRLSFNKPSPTLVTNPTMPATDLCHPVENRPLSVEEYKCIQGFPATWKIYGPILEQYKQIGNAVPIKLGEAIAKSIISDMKKHKRCNISAFPYSRYKNTNDESWLITFNQQLRKSKAM